MVLEERFLVLDAWGRVEEDGLPVSVTGGPTRVQVQNETDESMWVLL